MKTDHFKEIGEDLYGYGWQSRLARALGMDGSTVRRWVSGAVPVPPSASAYLRMMCSRQTTRGAYLALSHAQRATTGPTGHRDKPLTAMQRKIVFSGVERPKPVPTIHLQEGILMLGEEPEFAESGSFLVVRHPDSHHLEGYLKEMEKAGIVPATARGKHHHYTGIRLEPEGASTIRYVLSTHSGRLRIHESQIKDGTVIEDKVVEMPGIEAEGAQ